MYILYKYVYINIKLKYYNFKKHLFIEVGYNTDGELCVRGPNVMKGYLRNKAATDAVIDQDGFFHTGDIARVDENGDYMIFIIYFYTIN
jgi:long-subunit acyl-CoA synthetase (AMP-forming)